MTKLKTSTLDDLNTRRLKRLRLVMDFATTGLKWGFYLIMFMIVIVFMPAIIVTMLFENGDEMFLEVIGMSFIVLGIGAASSLALLAFVSVLWVFERFIQLFEQPTARKQKRRATSAATRRLTDAPTETQAKIITRPQHASDSTDQ